MGKIKVKHIGLKSSLLHDLYYRTLKASWMKFFSYAGIAYLMLNFLFALIYFVSPAKISNVETNSLWELFIFSFQTSTTIGYGYFLPESNSAHAIVIFDALIGVFYVAIITGLAFAKFARPSAKILFSNKVVFTTFDGVPSLMFRLANGRETHIVDAQIKISALLPYESKEGMKMRRFYKLNLLTDSNPAFSLSWTAIHQITEDSPLYGMDIEKVKELGTIFILSFTGIDDVLSQSIHTNFRFTKNMFIKAKSFKDILDTSNEKYELDFTNFNEVEI